uniref:Uncharacterized protein n=1 Tax=Candidatus Kentrum sp. MB TaxID=2138164 RepID=A0A450XK84_9GAMM|nr:MAG: hypothetical protein BECKMB1821G_GA0114241_101555 [Candidatus Kentron sp. MB]VFK29740.1 MAG: hypothetical protein BECKMB1821I_GA0114274_101154 [Candidatus Kentron sp. MB]VFK74891.1 MAG: hypothetical protein BECKMB1821H_GA0114242_101154 [Candidatus Kentron sp. MB]
MLKKIKDPSLRFGMTEICHLLFERNGKSRNLSFFGVMEFLFMNVRLWMRSALIHPCIYNTWKQQREEFLPPRRQLFSKRRSVPTELTEKPGTASRRYHANNKALPVLALINSIRQ